MLRLFFFFSFSEVLLSDFLLFRDKSNTPSGFTLKLRKHIRTRRLEDVRQLGYDRVYCICCCPLSALGLFYFWEFPFVLCLSVSG